MDYSLLIGVVRRHFEVVDRDDEGQERARHPFRLSSLTLKSNSNDEDISRSLMNSMPRDEDGGMHAEIVEGPGTYYIGIIDVLQEWNIKKKMEYYYKVYFKGNDKNGISAQPPLNYQRRFLKRVVDDNFEGLDGRMSVSRLSGTMISSVLSANTLGSVFAEHENDNKSISSMRESLQIEDDVV